MRYKKLNEKEKKRFLEDYVNLEVLKFKPEVGAIAYEAVVGGIVFFSGILTGIFYKPLGVVFDVGKDVKIVHLSERSELTWCRDNAYGCDMNIPTTDDDGRLNMDIIWHSCSDFNNDTLYPAFAYIRNIGKDWYLPAKDELNLIYKNKEKINKFLVALSKNRVKTDLLNDDWYWSSSSGNGIYAWKQRFSDGYQNDSYGGNGKNYPNSVRAVRALTI